MNDIRAVEWLPLDAALERLSRGHERAFLANVGPIALQAAASAETARRSRAKQPAPEKRRSRAAPSIAPPPSAPVLAMPAVAAPDFAEAAQDVTVLVESEDLETGTLEAKAVEAEAAVYAG